MSTQTIGLFEAKTHLSELVARAEQGEEVIITRNARPVAQLFGLPAEKPHPVPGRGRGKLVILTEDDEHLQDFQDYMP